MVVSQWVQRRGGETYVDAAELLLGCEDCAAALGCIQGALALDDGLALGTSWAAGLASDLGDSIPLRHGD